jgi:uncharacterized membrane protein
VVRGLSVVQGDAERDLGEFPSGAFDYVVFSRTLQHLRDPASGACASCAHRRTRRRCFDQQRRALGQARRAHHQGRLGPSEHLQRYSVRDFAELAREMRSASSAPCRSRAVTPARRSPRPSGARIGSAKKPSSC